MKFTAENKLFFTFRDYYSPFLSTSVRHPYKSYTQMEPPALTENFEKKEQTRTSGRYEV